MSTRFSRLLTDASNERVEIEGEWMGTKLWSAPIVVVHGYRSLTDVEVSQYDASYVSGVPLFLLMVNWQTDRVSIV